MNFNTGFKYYMIRDLATGLYSLGGACVRWGRKGKVWKTLGALKGHLALYAEFNCKQPPSSWEIVELNVTEGARYGIDALLRREK